METMQQFTVHGSTKPHTVLSGAEDDALLRYADYLRRYDVLDAAVVIDGKGRVSFTGQVLAANETEAITLARRGWNWVDWETLEVGE